ncbi:MAG: response regulator transcription factor [Cyanobacteria bacterium J06635_15]
MIRLLLVDDQTLVRQGFRVLLEAHEDIQVIGEAENGTQAIQQVEALQPDIVLLDIRMPEMDGVAAVQAICQQFDDVKVLMLSTFDDADYVNRAIRFGAIGYLLKDTNAKELIQAIRMAYQGYTQFGPGLFQKAIGCMPREPVDSPTATPLNSRANSLTQLPPELQKLTKREQEVLCHIITGETNRQIAEALFISERTVKNHVTSILSRLNLPGRVQAAMFAGPFLPLLQSRHEQT